jgi:alpha-galactosidase
MQNALNNITRPILYSLCNGGQANIQDWAGLVGQSWRATDDIQDNWPSILELIGINAYGVDHTDFHGHSDADMLEIGNGGLNHEQERSHFALWAAMKSPLLIGTNIANLKPSSLEILKSKTLIAFNQDDQYGKPAFPFNWDRTFRMQHPPRYWSGEFKGGVLALMLNINNVTSSLGFKFKESPHLAKGKVYKIVDGWTGKDHGCYAEAVSVNNVKAYDTAVLVLKDECSNGAQVNKTPDLEL